MDKLYISILNCEGLWRSKDYIRTYLDINPCESWHLDNNIDCFNTMDDN